MITASSAYNAANASRNKKPIWIAQIQGYKKAFSTRAGPGGAMPGLGINPVVQFGDKIVDFGGLSFVPSSAFLPKATPAGNLLFAFLYAQVPPSGTTVTDTAGNTWTLVFSTAFGGGSFSVWTATAVASGPGNQITWDISNTYNHHFAEFYVMEVDASYAGYSYGNNSGTISGGSPNAVITVGSNTVTVPGLPLTVDWVIFMAALAPVSVASAGINLCFMATAPLGPQGVPNIIDIAASGGSVVFCGGDTVSYEWIVSIDDLKITVSDLDGGSDLGDLVFNVQDLLQQITSDMATFIFEGKECRLLEGFVGMNLSDYLPRFRGIINTADSDNSNNEYKFTVSNFNLKKLSAKIYTQSDPDANGNTFTTDSNHPRTLNGHPLDILVSALREAGIALSDIDTAKIYYYRDLIFSGRTFVFELTEAPTAKDFIENEIMKPLGMYYRENNLGMVSIVSFYPAIFPFGGYTPAIPPARTLDVDNTTLVPLAMEADLVNQVIAKFDADGQSNFAAENIANFDESIDKYGLVDGHTIESQGMKSSFQGYFQAALTSFLIFLRYGLKNLVVDGLPALWSESLLESGDVLALTEPFVPDRKAGVMGIAAADFEVLDYTLKFMTCTIELKLLAIDLSKFKQFLITPNAEADFAADTAANQAKYMYLCDAAGKYSTGDDANTLG